MDQRGRVPSACQQQFSPWPGHSKYHDRGTSRTQSFHILLSSSRTLPKHHSHNNTSITNHHGNHCASTLHYLTAITSHQPAIYGVPLPSLARHHHGAPPPFPKSPTCGLHSHNPPNIRDPHPNQTPLHQHTNVPRPPPLRHMTSISNATWMSSLHHPLSGVGNTFLAKGVRMSLIMLWIWGRSMMTCPPKFRDNYVISLILLRNFVEAQIKQRRVHR
ncbi:hypothetical protein GmHk_14G041215 [Glycine max]|nr:hypothetical protein GmHk_14G041215 [Glycine max]